MKLKALALRWLPPIVTAACRRFAQGGDRSAGVRYGLTGDYDSWAAAVRAGDAYAAPLILERTKEALLKVKRGEAAHERDSVLFEEIQYSWPALAGLMWAAARAGGELNVLDFGGSLGSTYYQNRMFLGRLAKVRWNIIEQPAYAQAGRLLFADDRLHFYPRIEDCLQETRPYVAFLGSVLQYLEQPYSLLQQVAASIPGPLIIDRTPFWNGPADKLCLQRVPPEIYPASYPSWIFARDIFRAWLREQGLSVVAAFDNPDRLPGPVEFSYQGFILSRPPAGS